MNRYLVYLAIMGLLAFMAPASIHAQVGDGTGLNASFSVSEIHIEFLEDTIDESTSDLIRSSVLNMIRIFPHDHIRIADLDRAMLRIQSLPEVASASYDLELGTGQSYVVTVKISTKEERLLQKGPTGIFTKNARGSFPYFYRSSRFTAKLDLGATASVIAGDNTWLDNGEFFTQFSPFGNQFPPESRFGGFESAFTAGATLLFKLSKNTYLYGNYKAIFISTLGRDLFRADNPSSFGTENLYAGVVGTIPTSKGNVLNYNISAGQQPYRIGTGMLLCQIALNGGDRGGLNIWPRFSGDFVGLAQVRYDNLKAEYFFVDPNEYGGFESNTQLTGFNLEYGKPYGIKAGFTYLHALRSTSIVLFPDESRESRDGLNAYNLRLEWVPSPGVNSIIAKGEVGLQTNRRFPMRAWGGAAELGYAFKESKLAPSFSYRFSQLTGDDPSTQRYERWDILYSGNDVDTWIQGLIMKNILFNTNLQTHRFQAQMVAKGWRFTGQYFYFRSDELNNLPLAINTFASRELAHQITLMAEKVFLKRFYARILFHSLWAIDGINDALPANPSSPWTGFQALIKYQL
jgi:hypothetical protein